MDLTRDFKDTVSERLKNEPAFAQALRDEASTLFLNGETALAEVILCELADANLGSASKHGS